MDNFWCYFFVFLTVTSICLTLKHWIDAEKDVAIERARGTRRRTAVYSAEKLDKGA